AARVIGLGGLLVAAGSALTPHARSTWTLVLLIGIVTAGGAGMAGFGGLLSAGGRSGSPGERGVPRGVVNAGGAFGEVVVVPTAQVLTGMLGWVGAMTTVGAMALAVVPLARVLRGKPEATVASRDASAQSAAAAAAPSMRHAVRVAWAD